MQFNVDAEGQHSLRGGAQLASAVNVYIDGVSQKDFVGSGGGTAAAARVSPAAAARTAMAIRATPSRSWRSPNIRL